MQPMPACTLCGVRRLVTLKRYRVTKGLDEMWADLYARMDLPAQFVIRLALCLQCGFLFYRDQFSPAQLTQLYAGEARYARPKAHQLKPGRRWELDQMIRFLTTHLPRTKITTVLDIGAGDFVALERIVARYPRACYEAVDPSYPKRLHKGIRVYRTMVEDWHSPKRYDLVTLTHVLEHIGALRSFMARVHELVRPGRLLYVEVPFQVGPSLFFSRSASAQHINYFTPTTLVSLLARHGFVIDRLEFQTGTYAHNGMLGMIRLLARKQPAATDVRDRGILPTLSYLLNPLPSLRGSI